MKHNGNYTQHIGGTRAVRRPAPAPRHPYPARRASARRRGRHRVAKAAAGLSVLLLGLALLVTALLTLLSPQPASSLPEAALSVLPTPSLTPDEPLAGNEDITGQLQALAGEYPAVAAILADPSAYPESLLALLVRNPETLDYVLGYKDGPRPAADITPELQAGGVPHFLQWDARWGYETYGDDLMAVTGCGPTCLAMVSAALTGRSDATPFAIAAKAQQQGYYMPGVGTDWSLLGEGAALAGLRGEELPLDEGILLERLYSGSPIICSVSPGDFTTKGHFILLAGVNEDGTIQVHDPNSRIRSTGWAYKTLEPQIRNLWGYTAV